MPIRIFYCLLFLIFISPAFAAVDTPSVKLDSSRVNLRQFDESALQDYRSDRDFSYGEVRKNVGPTIFERFWKWFWNLFSDLRVDQEKGSQWAKFFKYFFIALGIGVIVFAIIKFTGMDFRLIFTGKPKQVDLPFNETIENIHEISFDAEIDQAIENRDYRLAVRLLYLKSLKGLNDAGRIKWEIDKTNSQYVNEMKHPDQKNEFRLLTRQFEFVWYGGFHLNEDSFGKIRESFRNFKVAMR